MTQCTACLEELSEAEAREGHSPCCGALVSDQHQDPTNDYESFLEAMTSTRREQQVVLAHIKTMSPDSKKRRKTYAKPTGADAWPGKIGADFQKKGRSKSRKERPPIKDQPNSLDIMSISEGSWEVQIKHPKWSYSLYGSDRQDARRKARSYLRGRGTSITVADSVVDSDGVTEIIYS